MCTHLSCAAYYGCCASRACDSGRCACLLSTYNTSAPALTRLVLPGNGGPPRPLMGGRVGFLLKCFVKYVVQVVCQWIDM